MAYNSYFPATYQPNYYAVNPYQAQYPAPAPQQAQPVQQVQPQPQNQSSILWVRNNQEAAMYPVAPNAAVALWDSGAPVIYLKQADASGKPSMKTYDLVERPERPAESVSAQEGGSIAYATKDELAALAGVVRDVDGVIASLKEEVSNLKAKATVKKAVRKDEDDG